MVDEISIYKGWGCGEFATNNVRFIADFDLDNDIRRRVGLEIDQAAAVSS